jgi:predicted AlkP superfamily pyrophosphatase or phosphodiesterase
MTRHAACAFIAIAVLAAGGAVSRPKRVILLSVDAGADWVVDALIARGSAPAFAALARDGAVAESMTAVLPTLTAPGHASLWTGAPPIRHGVTGNRVLLSPLAEHTLLESRSGFESGALRAEPIWITAARAGRRVLVPQATGGAPFSNPFPRNLLQFDIYANCRSEIELIGGKAAVDGTPFTFDVASTRGEVRRAADGTLNATIGETAVRLEPKGFTTTIPVLVEGRTATFRMGLLSDDRVSGAFTLLRGRVCELTSSNRTRVAAFRKDAGTIVGEGVTGYYARGRFGQTMAEGGSGDAEREVVEILGANQEYFDGMLAFAFREQWDLLVLYLPNFDAVLHALGGMIDESSDSYSAPLAERVWPSVERVFRRTVDDFVTELRTRAPDATLLVVADHGIEGASRIFRPNVTLRKAGLLALDGDTIDLLRTRALHVAGQGGSIFVNTTDIKRGIVPPADRGRIKSLVTRALLGVRDPADGSAVVRAVLDREIDGAGLGFGGENAPDLIFDLAAGYESSTALTGDDDVQPGPPTGLGEHGGAPWHRNLRAIFYAAGPGVRPGKKLGTIDMLDIAPTVAHLLGIPPPHDATGRRLPLE